MGRFFERVSPYRCALKVIGSVDFGKQNRLSPAEISQQMTRHLRFETQPEEVEVALRDSGLLSLVLTSENLNEILVRHREKIEATNITLGNFPRATTEFDVDSIVAKGGIQALGFSRVVTYEILPGNLIKSAWEWKNSEKGIECVRYLDSFFAEPRQPLEGEAIDLVLKTDTYKLVTDPKTDPACQVRPAHNPGPFAVFPGHGTLYMFDTLSSDRAIRPEDIELLDSLVKTGVAAKKRIKAEKVEQAAGRMRIIFSNQASDQLDLIKIFLICLTCNFAINRAVFWRWRPYKKILRGTFALGSTSFEDYQKALHRIKRGMEEGDIFRMIQKDEEAGRETDEKLNDLVRGVELEIELSEPVIVRGGRAYSSSNREIPELAETVKRIQALMGAKDFALVPVRTGRTNYGTLYLDKLWEGGEIPVEAVRTLARDFISAWKSMRRSEDRIDEEKKSSLWAQNQIEALRLLRNWIDVCRREIENISGHKMTLEGYFKILRQESREARTVKELKEVIANSCRRLLIPEKLVSIEIEEDPDVFLNLEWLNVMVEGGLLEVLRHLGSRVEGDPPHISYLPSQRIWIKIRGSSLVFSDTGEEKDENYRFQEMMDIGEGLIRMTDAEMREAGVGMVRPIISLKEIELILLRFKKK